MSLVLLLPRRLCTTHLSPDILSPFLACRLIALDKSPGVRPIGVCEMVRRIVAKAVLCVIRDDIQIAAGPFQLCAGQVAGTEAAVHTVRSVFDSDDSDAMLLVDATNAFNSLIKLHSCPAQHSATMSSISLCSDQHILFSCLLVCFK